MDHIPSGWVSFREAAELYQKALIGECQAAEQDHAPCSDDATKRLQHALKEGLIRACILDRESGVLVTLPEEFWAGKQVGKAIADKACSAANSDRPGNPANGVVLICKSDVVEANAPLEPTDSSEPPSSHEQELAAAPIEEAMSAEAERWISTAKLVTYWPIDFALVYLGNEQNLEAAIKEYSGLLNYAPAYHVSECAYSRYCETAPSTVQILAEIGEIEVFGNRSVRGGGYERTAMIPRLEWSDLKLNNDFSGDRGIYAGVPGTLHVLEWWQNLKVEREPFMKAVSKARIHGLASDNQPNPLHQLIRKIADELNPEDKAPGQDATVFRKSINKVLLDRTTQGRSDSTIKEALKGTKHMKPPKRKQTTADG
jgi:hypothetical protein